MASEASKIRNQCAKKYGVREKAYKDKITGLQAQLSEAEAKLADYERMKREYMKLVIFCGMNETDRNRVLSSSELENTVAMYGRFLGIADSALLREVANKVFNSAGAISLTAVVEELSKNGML